MHICWGRFRKQTFSVNQSDTAVSLDQIWMQADMTIVGTLHAPLDRRVARAAQRNLDASRAISPPRRRMGSSDELARCVPPPAGPIAPTIFNAPKRRKRIRVRTACYSAFSPTLRSHSAFVRVSLRMLRSGRTTAYTWRANDADAVMLCSNSSSAHR